MNAERNASIIFELLRRYNRKSRFVGRAFATGLTTTESHILIEIDAHPAKNISQLCDSLRVDKSTLSRALKGLVTRKILRLVPVPGDRRQARYEFTVHGRKTLDHLDEAANRHVSEFTKNLTPGELQRLLEYLKIMLDRDDAPAVAHRKNAIPILVEMRRAARAWGFIGRSLFGTDLSSGTWQILREIQNAPDSCSPSYLAHRFALSPATMSLNLKRLLRERYVIRAPSRVDRRRSVLSLAPRGDAYVNEVARLAEERVAHGIALFSEDEVGSFVDLLAKYVGETVGHAGVENDTGRLSVLESDEERTKARAFVVEHLVTRGLHHALPERLIAGENTSLAFSFGGALLGVAEIAREEGEPCLTQFVLDARSYASEADFLLALARYCGEHFAVSMLRVPARSLAGTAARSLGAVEKGQTLMLRVPPARESRAPFGGALPASEG